LQRATAAAATSAESKGAAGAEAGAECPGSGLAAAVATRKAAAAEGSKCHQVKLVCVRYTDLSL